MDILENELSGAKAKFAGSKKSLKETETRMNEQIHYAEQYLTNKPVYTRFLKAKNKEKFRQEHVAKITLYKTASRFLKEKSPGWCNSLKATIPEAAKRRKTHEEKSGQEAYRQDHDWQKEQNVTGFHGCLPSFPNSHSFRNVFLSATVTLHRTGKGIFAPIMTNIIFSLSL